MRKWSFLNFLLLLSISLAAQQPYLQKRICGYGNGSDYISSLDEINGNIQLVAVVQRSGGVGVGSIQLDPNGTVLFKDELILDSVQIINGYGGSAFEWKDSMVIASAFKWYQDSVLPAIVGMNFQGEIAEPRLLNEGFQFGSLHSGVATKDGGMMLLGGVQTDTGFFDFLLVKFDSSGEVQWHKTYGTTYWDRGFSICKGPDGGYFLGGVSRGVGNLGRIHIFIIRVDSNGKEIWRGDWGGYYDDWLGNMEYKEGVGLLVTGTKSGEKFYPIERPYVMLLDEDGEMKWNHHFTQTIGDTAAYDYFTNGKFIDGDKIILVGTGEVFDIISFEWRPIAVMLNHKGKILMQRMYTSVVNEKSHAWFEDVQQLSDGRIIAGGVYLPDTTNAQDTGNRDILIVELDENGCEYPGCQPPLGLEKVMEGEGVSAMHVFPNPSPGHLTIQCTEPVRSWSLCGLDGRLVMAGGTEAAEFEINASHLPAGMYILSVLGQNRQWVKRVVKE